MQKQMNKEPITVSEKRPRSKKAKKRQLTVPEISLRNSVVYLDAAIGNLSNAIVSLQTANPGLFKSTTNQIKETVGDLVVSKLLIAARIPKDDENG